MRRSYLETFFRHPLLLTLPIMLSFIAAVGYGLQAPRTYLAGGALWADTRVPAESTIGTTGGTDTPAAGQQVLLSELLSTHSFLLAVAQKSPFSREVQGRSPLEVDSALARMASGISVVTAGPHVVRVAVKQRTPELATGVADTVMAQFLTEQGTRLGARAAAQAQYDKRQLDAATRTLNDSKTGGGPTLSSSAAGSALVQQYVDAAKAYAKSSAAVANIDLTALSVVERPTQAYPQSRRKVILFAAAGGLLAGGTLSILALLVLMARDRSARAEGDIEEALGLDVVGTVVELPRARRQLEAGSRSEPTAIQGRS